MPSTKSLYDVLAEQFEDSLDSPWLVLGGKTTITYRELDQRSALVAATLQELGVGRGDRVSVHTDKSASALITYFGVLRAGAVYLPLNVAYGADELAYFLGDAEPTVVIGRPADEPWFSDLMASCGVPWSFHLDSDGTGTWADRIAATATPFVPVDHSSDDLAAILYTSGTTGRSKGAMITHRNLIANARSLHAVWAIDRSDVLIHALPIFHVHGLFVSVHPSMLSGIPIRFHTSFDASAVAGDLPNGTIFMGVPTMYTRLLAQHGFDRAACESIRIFTAGSAPLLPETFQAVKDRTGHEVVERYGMTETGILTSNPFHGTRKVGSVGAALPGVSVRIADDAGNELASGEVGAVHVQGENVFAGYWQMPDKTASEFTDDGWFQTGDIGIRDDDGYVNLIGRSKDLVISGGFNVYPKEIELVIDDLAGVDESAVIGVYHPDFGEAVVAVVVPLPGADLDEQSMIVQLKRDLASFKAPKAIRIAPELPRNTMGKVQKNLLREEHGAIFRPETTNKGIQQ